METQIAAFPLGIQRGQCGYAGCGQAAAGQAPVTLCPPGGRALAEALAGMLGVSVDLSSVADQAPTVARVHENRCVGCTKCLKRCPTDAIMAGPKMMHAIVADACTWVPLPSTRVPVVKGNNGVLALTAEEVNARPPTPCIRGASCVGACPCGLLPLEMAAHARVGDLEGAVRLGLLDCIGCSCCAYVCPPHIPLVQYFNHAKGEMAARERAKQKQTETKRLAVQRAARIEAQRRAKREVETPAEAEVGISGKITPLTARVSDGD